MVQELETYLTVISELLDDLRASKSLFVSKQSLRKRIADASKYWIETISNGLRSDSIISDNEINKVDADVEKLLELASANNRKSTYINIMNPLRKTVQRDILIPLIRNSRSSKPVWQGVAAKILGQISTNEERQYCEEAFRAASSGCYKAAIGMTWCAVVDRLHSFVKKTGLKEFNRTSKKLRTISSGFYKKFSKEFDIKLENELQEIFDRDLIIVISGMVKLDLNQTSAILRLFDTRNSCAHPSTYTIDELTFAHFLNEVYNLVLNNQKLL